MSLYDRVRAWLRPKASPEAEVHDLGDDPLDPHGDGTIGPGDPMWDVFTSGKPMIANRRDDGQWDVQWLESSS